MYVYGYGWILCLTVLSEFHQAEEENCMDWTISECHCRSPVLAVGRFTTRSQIQELAQQDSGKQYSSAPVCFSKKQYTVGT